jgi:hypothetical protein
MDSNFYKELNSKLPIEGWDFDPIVIDNVLSDKQIEQAYRFIDKNKESAENWAGRKSWMIDDLVVRSNLTKTIQSAASLAIGEDLTLNEYPFFLRYSPQYGYISKLFPHIDYRDSQRVTVDLQLNYDEDWAVVIEGKSFNLKFNQALIFLGTQQMHWRENKNLKNDSVIDMLISNLHFSKDRPLCENQINIADEKSFILKKHIGVNGVEQKND